MVCDGYGWQLGVFRTLGRNSLAAYLVQWPLADSFVVMVERTSTWSAPGLGYPPDAIGRNAPAIFIAAAFVLYLFVNWLVLAGHGKEGHFLEGVRGSGIPTRRWHRKPASRRDILYWPAFRLGTGHPV